MAGQANDLPAWSPEDFAAMGAFMEAVNRELVESGESIAARAWLRRCTPGGLAYRAACRSSLTACTPTPRTRWPVTGSWKLRPGDRNCRPACGLHRTRTCRRQRVCRRTADRGIRRRSFRLGREALTSSADGKGS